MAIGIFAREDDPIAERIESIARARGVEALRIAFGRIAGGLPVAFDKERWLVEDMDLLTLEGFLLRHYPSETAMLSADPARTLTATEWWQRGLGQKERSHFAQSCIMALELAQKRVVNPLQKSAPYDQKPFQLAAFYKAGFPLPRTLITNDPEKARAFAREVGPAIAKPSAGGAETRVVDEALLLRFDAIRSQPAIFQERIFGPDIRVTVVAGRVLSAVEIPTSEVDYRTDETYQSGMQEYLPHALPADVEELCLAAARLCHHVLSGIDLKRRADGSYVLLEANSAPVYLDIERKTGAPISEALVDYLLGG